MSNDIRFFDPRAELHVGRNRLPHWSQDNATYFITFRLADALPERLLKPWREERDRWRAQHPPPWSADVEQTYHRLFSIQISSWLDAGHGSCLLRNSSCAHAVFSTMRHDDLQDVEHHAIVIMPNHVHALSSLTASTALPQRLRTWKGVSARHINAHCQRTGPLWQRDYFDRLVRDEEHLHRCVRYIRSNPIKANLRDGEYLLYESELAKAIE